MNNFRINKAIIFKLIIVLDMIAFISLAFIAYKKNDFISYQFDFSNFVEDGSEESWGIDSEPFMIPEGSYRINVAYISDVDGFINAQIDNDMSDTISLESTDGEGRIVSWDFYISHPTDKAKLRFRSESNPISLISVELISLDGKHFNNDGIYLVLVCFICFVILGIICWMVYKGKLDLGTALILVGCPILFSIPVFIEKGLTFGIDIDYHLLRIQGLYQGLKEGQFPVIIYPNMNNHYGQMGALYPSLFLYIPALLRFFNVSLLMIIKSFIIVENIATTVVMYYICSKTFSDKKMTAIATILYSFDAYRFYVEYYGGGSMATGIAMVFIPVVIMGLYHVLLGDKKKWTWLAIGMAGLINCHVISAVLLTLFAIVIFILNIYKINKQMLISLLKASLLAFGLSIGTIMNFLSFYFTDWGRDALMWSDYASEIFSFHDFDDMYFTEPTILLLSVIVLYFIIGRKCSKKRIVIQNIVICTILWVLSTKILPWRVILRNDTINKIMTTIQFGHRFYSILMPVVSIIIAYLIAYVDKKRLKIFFEAMLVVLLVVTVSLSTIKYYGKGMLLSDSISGDINSRFNEDYLPEGTLTEYYYTDTGTISDDSVVESFAYSKDGTHIEYSYFTNAEGQYAEFPLFYYKGYEAISSKYDAVKVEKGGRNRVRVYLDPTDEQTDISVFYKVNSVLKLAYIVELICIGFTIVFFLNKHLDIMSIFNNMKEKKNEA